MFQVSHKRVTAINKYMNNYNVDVITSYITYLDANNLYGLAMSKLLPYADFNWCDIDIEQILNYDENSETGYLLEVDLEYPKELHDKHNDYPLAPELIKVKADMLSSKSWELHKNYNSQHKTIHDEQTEKLILSLNDKTNYIIHINKLKYYLEQGLKIKQNKSLY